MDDKFQEQNSQTFNNPLGRRRLPHRRPRDIKAIQRTPLPPLRRERVTLPSILANFKLVLSQFKSAYEEGDTSNAPFPGVGCEVGTVSKPSPVKPWVFTTKPKFKRLEKSFKEPMIDVFEEASEVQIIIDLGNFKRGEVDIDIKPDKYIIFAKKGEQEFREEIVLPPDADIENTEEYFRNGILQIILPKKRGKT